jgi:putative N6-adenine-specific DNA methylase
MPMFRDVEPSGEHALFADAEPRILASDTLESASEATRASAERAGVLDSLQIETSDFRDLSARSLRASDRETGLILSNPPYGERLQSHDLEELYGDLAQFCAGFPGYRAAFLVANPDFERAFGHRPRIKKPLSNGPLRGYFYLYDF